MTSSFLFQNKKQINVPKFDRQKYDRFLDSSKSAVSLASAIDKLCKNNSANCLVVSGHRGIGKTWLVAKVLNGDDVGSLEKLPLMGALWISSVSNDYAAFYHQLCDFKKSGMATGQPAVDFDTMLTFQLDSADATVLFVVDNVRHLENTLKNIKELNSKQSRFILITNCIVGKQLNGDTSVEVYSATDGVSVEQIEHLISNVFFIGNDNLQGLAEKLFKISYGCPNIVSLVVNTVSDGTELGTLLDYLQPMPGGLPELRQIDLVLFRLFQKILKQFFDHNQLKKLWAMLLFCPEAPVELDDLAILTRSPVDNVELDLRKFVDMSLIQRLEVESRACYAITTPVHVAAAKCCVRFGVATSLSNLRSRLAGGGLIRLAVDARREHLLRTVISNCDMTSLTSFCYNQREYGNGMVGPLQYIYESQWLKDEDESKNVSCRILVKLLRRFSRLQVYSLVTLPDANGQCLLLLLAENNDANDSWPEHKILVDLVKNQGGFTMLSLARDRRLWNTRAMNADDCYGALLAAVIRGQYANVEKMLRENCDDVDNTCEDGSTCLIAAAAIGHAAIVELLLKDKSTNVEAVDNAGATALITASNFGHREVVRILIETGKANVDAKNNFGTTSTMLAAQYGFTEVVELLNSYEADLDAANCQGGTALMAAAQNGHDDVVAYLIDRGVNSSMKNQSGVSALVIACQNGFSNIVDMILASYHDVCREKTSTGLTPLMAAAKNGHTSIMVLLNSDGIDVNAQSNSGETALMFALENQQIEAFNYLISLGPDLDLQTIKGVTALMLAVAMCDVGSVRILLNENADFSIKDDRGVSSLLLAVTKNSFECVKLLIEAGANINDRDNDGVTALIAASSLGSLIIVEYLVDNGAFCSWKCKKGINALMAACQMGHSLIVDLLLPLSDVNAIDVDGLTALMFAAMHGYIEIVKQLVLSSGKAVTVMANRRSSSGNSALMLAAMNGHADVVAFLASPKIGADVNTKNTRGMSSLMLAASNGHTDCVKELLEHGANVMAKNYEDLRATDLAIEAKHDEVVELLVNAI